MLQFPTSPQFIHPILSPFLTQESLDTATDLGYLPADSHVPFAAFFICVGFFVVYVIEAFVHKAFNNHHGGGGGGHSHGVPTTTEVTTATTAASNMEMDDSSSNGSGGGGGGGGNGNNRVGGGVDNGGFVGVEEMAGNGG